MKRKILPFLFLSVLALLSTGCRQAAPPAPSDSSGAAVSSPAAPAGSAPAASAVQPSETPQTEDHVLLTLEAPLADGRTLTLEAVGKAVDECNYGVREVLVYDEDKLLQTVSVREAIEEVWGYGDGAMAEEFYDYTQCWTSEECMAALDLNFDGNADFGLFGWPPNNTIPFYYWIWDANAEQYRYAFTLQGVAVSPEAEELTSQYKDGPAGSQWITEYYRPGADGMLYLTQVEVTDWANSQDADRPVYETWVLPEDAEPIPAGSSNWSRESDLILVSRAVPTIETHDDNTVSRFTETWELKDGTLQMTGREEYHDG